MNTKAFTLVELIIIATILIILGVVGVIMFQRNLTDVRDTTRIVDIKNIYEELKLYTGKNNTAVYPNNSIEITSNGQTIAYQGELSENIAQQINYDGNMFDPLTGQYYHFFIDAKFNTVQVVGYLENPDYTNNIFDNFEIFPYIQGDDNAGFIIDANTQNSAHFQKNDIDLSNIQNNYLIAVNNNDILSSDDENIAFLGSAMKYGLYSNCKELLDNNSNLKGKNGAYLMQKNKQFFRVYCDMTTDNGGWTISTMSDGGSINLFETQNQGNIDSLTQNISSVGNILQYWDDIDSRDILLQCFTSSAQHQGYTKPLIIYDYEKSDGDYLVNNEKRGATFASKVLKGKWDNNNFYISPQYGTNGDIYSFEIYQSDAQGNPGYSLFELTNGTSLKASSAAYKYSPAYRLSGGSVYEGLDQNNYCISAIR